MENIYNKISRACIALLGAGFLTVSSYGFSSETVSSEEIAIEVSWQEMHSDSGKCSMKFPGLPEHVSETMQMDEEGVSLQYDAYIASKDSSTVFMLLVAQYPDFVDERFAHMSLEAFLNGILTNNPSNQLLFADLVLIQGYEGLDFFIRSGSTYFKGRALMVKNQLYLMAMECAVQNYDETHYNTFVDSFLLKHS
jgi:hypothetical protein